MTERYYCNVKRNGIDYLELRTIDMVLLNTSDKKIKR